MSGCYCETVYDGYCGHCFDAVERERDEARELLAKCLDEINNALNYWYPLKEETSEEEHHARHIRLFQFRDELKKMLEEEEE